MYPTLRNQEQVFGEKFSLKLRELQRGDIVIFKDPDSQHLIIKRIIALPGDIFEIKEGNVWINNKVLEEPYCHTDTRGGKALRENKEYEVPKGQFVLLGDNRKISLDSREKGFIKQENIISRAIVVYYPLRNARILK